MKFVRDLSHYISTEPTIATIGNFDAMHRGHQFLIDTLISQANMYSLSPVLITFEPLPAEFFSKKPPARLSSFKEKGILLQQWPLDYVICLRFNKTLSHMSATTFIKKILIEKLHVKRLILGEDFRFGYQRQGDLALLRQFHFEIETISPQTENGNRISSTDIRKALTSANLKHVSRLLNRPYSLSGHVAYGFQQGIKLGFPTINIPLRRKSVALHGIYLVQVKGLSSSPLPGVANIGNRPALNPTTKPLLEVHLLHFNKSVYGRYVTVEFIKKLRDEKSFDSTDLLKAQIEKDVETAKVFFSTQSA